MNKELRKQLLDSVEELHRKGFLPRVDLTPVYSSDDDVFTAPVHEAAVPFRNRGSSVRSRTRRELNKVLTS